MCAHSSTLKTATNLGTAALNVDALATSAVDVAVEVAIETADHLISMDEWWAPLCSARHRHMLVNESVTKALPMRECIN